MRATLPDLFADRRPASEAAFLRAPDGGVVVTYADLETEVERWASGLWHSGVRRGDRVVYQVEKSPAALTLHLALLRCGAVQVPVNPAYVDSEVAALLADAEPVWSSVTPHEMTFRSLAVADDGCHGEGTAAELATDVGRRCPPWPQMTLRRCCTRQGRPGARKVRC